MQPYSGPPGYYAAPGYGPQQQAARPQGQPLQLARFPGDALHSPPGAPPPQPYGGQPHMGPRPAYSIGAPPPMQPFQPMMAGQLPPPRLGPQGPYMGAGGPPPLMGAYPPGGPQGYGGAPGPAYLGAQRPPPVMVPLQPPSPAHVVGALRSGAATPKSLAGSGAATPVHPMQRTLSGGQVMAAPPGAFMGQPGLAPMGPLAAPQPYLMPPPPGIVLPDSLSPAAPGPLGPSAPGSRAQSAAAAGQLAHSRAGSYGGPPLGGPMEPLGSPQRQGLARAGSAGSLPAAGGGTGGASLRGSLDLGGSGAASPVRRSSERAGSAGLAAAFQPGASQRPASLAGSRAGSAGRRGPAGSTAGVPPPPPEAPDEYDNIKVAVRVRPPNAQELSRGDSQALFVNPSDFRQVQLVVPAAYSRSGTPSTRNYTFHACLGPASRQQARRSDVLRLCGITQLLDAALDGYNATVMAYGQTGSGKTFTMSGREDALLAEGYGGDSDDGIIARALAYLFEQLGARSAADGCRYTLRCSFLEIYNEQVYDLIRFDRRQLAVRWDAAKGFHAPDLACPECSSLEETLQLVSLAVRHRRVGSHELNMESSRSHSIFTVYVDCTPTRSDDHEFGMTRYGKVSFVDLAGSERLRDSKSAGETLKETTSINRSLFMLGKVIAALADGAHGARVPYRESKLTKLLMDSLGGSSLSLLIACCSPSAAHVEETLSTLGYAARAKNIRNQPAVQVDPEQAAIAALRREVKLLRTENTYLREQLMLANQPRQAGGASLAASRLPTSHGVPGGGPNGAAPPLLAPPGAAAVLGSRPASGGAAAAAGGAAPAAAAPGGAAPASASTAAGGGAGPSPEELMRRLLDTQRMLVQFSRENDRLAGENGRLRQGKNLVANDYKGALEEVEWLRAKLESLETALLAGSLDSGLLAALDGAPPGSGGSPGLDVLEAARAAVAGAGGLGLLVRPPSSASAGATGEEAPRDAAQDGSASPSGVQSAGGGSPAAEAAAEEATAAPAASRAEPVPEQAPAVAAAQATKPPLIDRYLIANPSELSEPEPPAAAGAAALALQPATGSGSSSSSASQGRGEGGAGSAAGAEEPSPASGEGGSVDAAPVASPALPSPEPVMPEAAESLLVAGCTATVTVVSRPATAAKGAQLPTAAAEAVSEA